MAPLHPALDPTKDDIPPPPPPKDVPESTSRLHNLFSKSVSVALFKETACKLDPMSILPSPPPSAAPSSSSLAYDTAFMMHVDNNAPLLPARSVRKLLEMMEKAEEEMAEELEQLKDAAQELKRDVHALRRPSQSWSRY